MEFRILGPLEVVEDGRPVPLGQGRERALLALLLLHANEVVAADVLIDDLWQGEPPTSAVKSLQVYVSRLRKRLGAETLTTRSPGYAVQVEPEALDVMRFDRLVNGARVAEPPEAATMLREALALWRGPALAEFAYESWARPEVARLDESRLAALEDRIDADLALGRHAALVAELEALVAQHPYRERLCGQLMLALYRSGRQADALSAYRDARRRFDDELGLQPAEQLRNLERRILEQDGTLAAPADAPEADGGSPNRAPSRRRRRWAVVAAAAAAVLVLAAVGAAIGLAGGSSEPLVASPNSVALVDPSTNRVVAVIPVDDRPTKIAVGGGSVWVLHPDARTLTRIDPERREVAGTVGLGGAPSGLAVNRQGAWVSDAVTGAITLIEPERMRAVGRIETLDRPIRSSAWGTTAGSVAIGLGSIWVSPARGRLSRIDPRGGRTIAHIRPVASGGPESSIAVGRDAVWVGGDHPWITRVDPRRNQVTAQVDVRSFRLNDLLVASGHLWATDVGNDQVWAIDTITNQPIGSTTVGGQPLGLATGAGSIWVSNSGDGTLSRIDPALRQVVSTISVGGSPHGIAADAHGIWVTVD